MLQPEYIGKDGVAIFTTSQIDTYGLPENNGWLDRYWVIETPEMIFGTSYKDELEILINSNKIHRYCRLSRFKTCFFQLTGLIGFSTKKSIGLKNSLVYEIPTFILDFIPPCLAWEELRKRLKKEKLQIFYNRIPALAIELKIIKPIKITTAIANAILSDFESMNEIFPRIKDKLKRKYFPNLRFIALKLLERYQVDLQMKIPFARSPSKEQLLVESFNEIWDYINEETDNSIFG